MRVMPITCFRPTPERAGDFSAPPYDVFDDVQARAYVAEHPDSFMAIDRPETAFGPEQDPYAPEVYQRALELLRERVQDQTLLREESECLFVYRMSVDGHDQTGILAAVAVDDYLEGAALRHEQVREEKVADRKRHMETVGAQTSPSLLIYPDDPTIDMLVDLACSATPLYDFTDEDGVRHTVWRLAREAAVEALCATFDKIERSYVADGHHRAAASARICQEARAAGESAGASESFLAILYPASAMRVLAYNRVVSDAVGMSEDELIEAIRAAGVDVGPAQKEAFEPAEEGTVSMYAFGSWRALRFLDVLAADDDPTAALDVSLLQRRVLAPVLGIEDPTADKRIRFVSGAEGTQALERLAGTEGVAFFMYPTSVEALMRVSDAGLLMPPKSTWFAPKPRSGLFLRKI